MILLCSVLLQANQQAHEREAEEQEVLVLPSFAMRCLVLTYNTLPCIVLRLSSVLSGTGIGFPLAYCPTALLCNVRY